MTLFSMRDGIADKDRYIQHSVMYHIDTGCSESILLEQIYEDWVIYKLNPLLHPLVCLKLAIESLITQGRIVRKDGMLFWSKEELMDSSLYKKDQEWISENNLEDKMLSTDAWTNLPCSVCGKSFRGYWGEVESFTCKNCLKKEKK